MAMQTKQSEDSQSEEHEHQEKHDLTSEPTTSTVTYIVDTEYPSVDLPSPLEPRSNIIRRVVSREHQLASYQGTVLLLPSFNNTPRTLVARVKKSISRGNPQRLVSKFFRVGKKANASHVKEELNYGSLGSRPQEWIAWLNLEDATLNFRLCQKTRKSKAKHNTAASSSSARLASSGSYSRTVSSPLEPWFHIGVESILKVSLASEQCVQKKANVPGHAFRVYLQKKPIVTGATHFLDLFLDGTHELTVFTQSFSEAVHWVHVLDQDFSALVTTQRVSSLHGEASMSSNILESIAGRSTRQLALLGSEEPRKSRHNDHSPARFRVLSERDSGADAQGMNFAYWEKYDARMMNGFLGNRVASRVKIHRKSKSQFSLDDLKHVSSTLQRVVTAPNLADVLEGMTESSCSTDSSRRSAQVSEVGEPEVSTVARKRSGVGGEADASQRNSVSEDLVTASEKTSLDAGTPDMVHRSSLSSCSEDSCDDGQGTTPFNPNQSFERSHTRARFQQLNYKDPTFLPVKPLTYELQLSLHTRRDLLKGKLELECEAMERCASVELFYSGSVHSVQVCWLRKTMQVALSDIYVLDESSKFVVPLPATMEAGSKFKLLISFRGEISPQVGQGVYSCSATGTAVAKASKVGGAQQDVFVGTHFEPQWCREAFPCIDKPNAKAKFSLTLTVPQAWEAISCGSVLSSEAASGSQARRKVVFETTPTMPVYAFGFWAGPFARQSCKSARKGIPVTLYGVPERMRLGEADFGLFIAQHCLDFFSDLFQGTPYPLQKLSVICMPRLYCMGMENLGAISIHHQYAFVTPDTPIKRRLRIERLFAHEVCHQWYGDLVTPATWEELWLKEGMARFLEFLAVDHVRRANPGVGQFQDDWDVWMGFIREVMGPAMRADSGPSSHSVVSNERGRSISTVLQSFDTITYGKGAFLLRMLSLVVGVDGFVESIRRLLRTHAFGVSTRHDLWNAVQVSCETFVDPIAPEPAVGLGHTDLSGCLESRTRGRVPQPDPRTLAVNNTTPREQFSSEPEAESTFDTAPTSGAQHSSCSKSDSATDTTSGDDPEFSSTSNKSPSAAAQPPPFKLETCVGARSMLDHQPLFSSLLNSCSIAQVMESWLSQPGFPRLYVRRVSSDFVTFSQRAKGTSTVVRWLDGTISRGARVPSVTDGDFVRVTQLTQSQLDWVLRHSEPQTSETVLPRHSKPHWVVPLSMRVGYVHTSPEGEKVCTEHVSVWMEPGVSQVDVQLPDRHALLSHVPARARARARPCVLVNCDALAFAQVRYGDQWSWNAALRMLRANGASPVEAVALVQDEILGFIHADESWRSRQGTRLHKLEEVLRSQPPGAARATLLEFSWGLKAYATDKLVRRAERHGVAQTSVDMVQRSPRTSARAQEEEDEDDADVQVVRERSESSGSSVTRDSEASGVTSQELLLALDRINKVLKDLDSAVVEHGGLKWAVESAKSIKREVAPLATKLWDLLVGQMGHDVPDDIHGNSKHPRNGNSKRSISQEEVDRSPENNPLFNKVT